MSLAKSSKFSKYSPALRLMLLHLLLQRYFSLLKDSLNEHEEFTSTDSVHDTVAVLTDVFAKLMVRDSEPIVQLQAGLYYNIFVVLRQGPRQMLPHPI